MTKTEIAAIQNVIKRLKKENLGCSLPTGTLAKLPEQSEEHASRIEYVSRLYLDTWVIPALELLLPGNRRNPELARDLVS
jgi:hypothetical protein|nr:MAG TPA: hypothetical protein [Caudoviricetes sp.]